MVELLIVTLIMAILMAVALPLYLGAVGDAQVKTCRANMASSMARGKFSRCDGSASTSMLQ